MLEKGPVLDEKRFSAESMAISSVIKDPRTLEDKLSIIGNEVVVSTGKIDLLVRDGKQRFVVIEFEREAGDSTIGQVVRLAAGLAEREQIDASGIRKMVVCRRMNDNVKKAANAMNIEVRTLASVFSE
jgi:RecB family endonuclease NucS